MTSKYVLLIYGDSREIQQPQNAEQRTEETEPLGWR